MTPAMPHKGNKKENKDVSHSVPHNENTGGCDVTTHIEDAESPREMFLYSEFPRTPSDQRHNRLCN